MTHRRFSLLAVSAILLSGALLSLQANAQESSPAPKAVVPNSLVDLGKHARGNQLQTEFEIRNEGDAPLMLFDTKSSCSCLVAEMDPVVAPGETGKVVVDVDTEVLEGPSRQVVYVLTNDPENPQIQLQVNFESTAYLLAKPSYFHYTAYRGFQGEATIETTVLATDPKEFSIESVESTYPGLSVDFREATPEERISGFDGPQYRVTASLDPTSPIGPLTGFVRVHTTHEKQKLFSMPVSGFIRPVVAVTPPRMDLGTFSVDETKDGYAFTVRVQHFLKNATDLQIEKIESDLPNLQSKINEGRTDHDWWVDLFWSKDDVPTGKFSGTVKIHTTSELAPVVELEVEGEHVS